MARYVDHHTDQQDDTPITTNWQTPSSPAIALSNGGEPAHRLDEKFAARHSRLFGRQQEVAAARQQLLDRRLLTLTGPGGIGKTRLAMAVAESLAADFHDRIHLIEFAPVTDPALVVQVVAAAVDASEHTVLASPRALAQALAPHRTLLVFDNCEHLRDACGALICALRAACPHLYILVTSREALGLTDEVVRVVPPLEYPAATSYAPLALMEMLQSAAVQLFVACAWDANPAFRVSPENLAAIGRLCRQFEGLPLAIELAAGHLDSVDLERITLQVADLLHARSSATRNGSYPHPSLSAALDWSYRLLSAAEQTLFRRLAIFAGGWSRAAAAAVYADDADPQDVRALLASLTRASLITRDPATDEPRYRMLEPIRQYAWRHLEHHGEVNLLQERHLAYFDWFCRRVEPELIGANQHVWNERLERDLANLRAAMDRAIAAAEDDPDAARTRVALALPTRLERFWMPRGRSGEGAAWLTRALALPGATHPAVAVARAYALNARGILHCSLGLDDTVRKEVTEALSIAEAMDDPLLTLVSLRNLGTILVRQGEAERGAARLERALEVAHRLGPGVDHSIAWSRLLLGSAAYLCGDARRAAAHFSRAVELFRVQGDINLLALALRRLSMITLRQGDLHRAATLLRESLEHNVTVVSPGGIAATAGGIAGLLLARSQPRAAAQVLAAADVVLSTTTDTPVSLDAQLLADNTAEVRNRLGAHACAAIWAQSSSMTTAAAIGQICKLAATLTVPEQDAPDPRDTGTDALSRRERQVAILVAQGRSNREIADTLRVEVKTVEAHVTRIMGKLGSSSRVQIATWAVARGLVAYE